MAFQTESKLKASKSKQAKTSKEKQASKSKQASKQACKQAKARKQMQASKSKQASNTWINVILIHNCINLHDLIWNPFDIFETVIRELLRFQCKLCIRILRAKRKQGSKL